MSRSHTETTGLSARLRHCMRRDQHRLRQALKRARGDVAKTNAVAAQIKASVTLRQARADKLPIPHYPAELPVSRHREAIAAAIREHPVVIVAGETGSGKTTQLPKICLELGRGVAGFIGHTQPRRLAARSVAARIAEELDSPLGEQVGYKVRFSDHTRASSYVKLMTDGILLAELQGDRFLDDYDTLIIDEAHERSLNIDFLLGYLKQLLPKRKDLKVIITSATIDTARFSIHFNDAPVIEVSGRSYPVEIRYQDNDEEQTELSTAILNAVDELAALDARGDILVFLSSEREIRETAEALRKHHPRHTEVLPLYSRLSASEQNRVFQLGEKRRIILATNVAETSITVPGIRYVIDPGKARISRYSYRSKVQRLPIEKIAQSSANQRAGRCGRLSEGVCIRLYSEDDFLSRPAFTQPEIQRTNLAAVILQMHQLGLGDPAAFPFIDPPDTRFINDGYRLLRELNAMDEQRRLTPIGKRLARLPIDPRLGRMVLAAELNDCLNEVLVIVSALSVQDPRERPTDKQQQADEQHRRWHDEGSDFAALLNLWREYNNKKHHLSHNKLRQYCHQHFLSYLRMREWLETFQQLRSLTKGMGMVFNTAAAHNDVVHQSLLTGLLGNIGVKEEAGDSKQLKSEEKRRRQAVAYRGARQSTFYLFPGSGLGKRPPHWLMAAELVETSRLFARQTARIEPEWIEAVASHLVKRHYGEPHWNPKRGIVMADETVSLYGLVIQGARRVNYGPVDPVVSREVFIREALVEGNYRTRAPFFHHNQKLMAEARAEESKTRRQDVLVDEQALVAFFHSRIPATVRDHASFERWRQQAEAEQADVLRLQREDVFRNAAESADAEYPGEILIDGMSLSCSYCFSPGGEEDGVTVHIPVAAINQFQQAQFDFLVPGLLPEKITALLKGLPKPLRKQLVPVPDTVQAALVYLDTHRQAQPEAQLLSLLSDFLLRHKGLMVTRADWGVDHLPAHLRMRFVVEDQHKKSLGKGRELAVLQAQVGEQAAAVMAQLDKDPSWPEEGITTWDFGDLPESLMLGADRQQYRAYPALVDRHSSVGVQLFDAPHAAQQAHVQGLRRLAMLVNAKAVKYLQRNLPHLKEMALIYSTQAPVEALQGDLMVLILEQCCFAGGYRIRTAADFAAAMQHANELPATANRVCQRVQQIVSAYQLSRQQFQALRAKCSVASRDDIQAQFDALLYPGFLIHTPYQWLQEMPRYFRALSVRLEKLVVAPAGDEQKLQQLRPFLQAYARLEANADASRDDAQAGSEITRLRWMLEEYRVSLFAQPMKTAISVSPKRLEKQLARCQ